MYICDICGDIPGVWNRRALVFNDGKIKAEIKGHSKCINKAEQKVREAESKHKGKRDMTIRAKFKVLGLDMEDYLLEY